MNHSRDRRPERFFEMPSEVDAKHPWDYRDNNWLCCHGIWYVEDFEWTIDTSDGVTQ